MEEHKDKTLHAVDLPDPERMVKEFWDTVNNPSKANVNIISAKDVTIESNPLNRTGRLYRSFLKKQAIKTSDKWIAERQKNTVIQYLTDHSSAKTAEIAEVLDVSVPRARAILNKLIDEDVVIAEGANRNRTYRLKA